MQLRKKIVIDALTSLHVRVVSACCLFFLLLLLIDAKEDRPVEVSYAPYPGCCGMVETPGVLARRGSSLLGGRGHSLVRPDF